MGKTKLPHPVFCCCFFFTVSLQLTFPTIFFFFTLSTKICQTTVLACDDRFIAWCYQRVAGSADKEKRERKGRLHGNGTVDNSRLHGKTQAF